MNRKCLFLLFAMLSSLSTMAQLPDSIFGDEPSSVIIPLTQIDTNKPVGKINGVGNVTATGAATYQIPIDIPTGEYGYAPSPQLVYSSQMGNGLAGYGWNLTGMSAITRCGNKHFYDGNASEIQLTDNDNISLDGKRLVRTSGTNLWGNSTYRLEDDPTSKILTLTTGFRLYLKDGTTCDYGTTSDSRVGQGNVKWMWLLKSMTDLRGRTIVYTYDNSRTNEPYLTRIDYEDGKSVRFTYEQRPDIHTAYVAGQPVPLTRRLSSVSTYVQETKQKEYRLDYNYDNYYSNLSSVTLYGQDGTSLNPTTVTYTGSTTNRDYLSQYSNMRNGGDLLYGDFDGDGRTDFVSSLYYISTGSSFFQITPMRELQVFMSRQWGFNETFNLAGTINANIDKLFVKDFDGDGKSDLMIQKPLTDDVCRMVRYTYEDGSLICKDSVEVYAGDMIAGDFDGDGKADFLNIDRRQITDRWGNILASAPDINFGNTYSGLFWYFLPRVRNVQDFNGNGKEDILITESNSIKVYELHGGTITELTSFTSTSFSNLYEYGSCDFNGDGLTDLMAKSGNTAWFYLSTGRSFVQFASLTVNADMPVYFGDFNADGKGDIFFVSRDGSAYQYTIGMFNGTCFIISRYDATVYPGADNNASINDYISRSCVADFDGDGHTEFAFAYSDNSKSVVKHFATNQTLLASEIIDGFGTKTRYTYVRTNTPFTCITDRDYTYPLARLSSPVHIVSSINVFGDGQDRYTTYQYRNPMVQMQGKGFLGFTEIKAVNNQDTITSRFSLLPTYYYPYLSYKERRTLSGTLVETEKRKIGTMNATTIRPYTFTPVLLCDTVYNALTGLTKTRAIGSDSYGNPISIHTNHGDGHSESLIANYDNITTGKWVIGQLTSSTRLEQGWTERKDVEYNVSRLPSRIKDYRGSTSIPTTDVRIAYDSYGNITSRSVKTYSSSDSLTTAYTYTSDHSSLASETDPYGQTTTYTYDSNGRLSGIAYPDGLSVAYEYDGWGRQTLANRNDTVSWITDYAWSGSSERGLWRKQVSKSDGSKSITYYNAYGQDVGTAASDYVGNLLKQNRSYDNRGRLSSVSMPYKGQFILKYDRYSYDEFNRLSSIAYAKGDTVSWLYNGLSVSTTEDGIGKTRTYDARGRLLGVTDPAGTVSYTLRPDGQPSRVEALGVVTTFNYDAYGRRTAINDPSGGMRTFAYDAAGRVAQKTDADGRTVSIAYDALGRIASEQRAEMTTSYSYDSHNRLSSISSSNGSGKLFSYDNLGRLYYRKDLLPNNKYLRREYAYSHGELSSISYSNQSMELGTERMQFQYGHLYNISFDQIHVWHLIEENSSGLCTMSHSAVINRSTSYDANDMLTGIGLYRGNQYYQDLGLSFNTVTGNLLLRNDNIRNLDEQFSYDALNRLTSYAGDTVVYNAMGNILTKSDAHLQMAYDNTLKPYAVTSIAPGFSPSLARYSYQRITYNSFECPDTIYDNGVTTTFLYDAAGNRVMMHTDKPGLPTRCYVDDIYEEELCNNRTIYRLYLGGDAYSAPAVLMASADSVVGYYLGRDHLGSITHITNENGDLLYEYSYDAWGRLRNPATHALYAVDQEPQLFLGRGYCGHEHLPWCGLVNMNARLYDPVTGRFLSPDPFVQLPDFSQNFNRYSYCLNNPLRYVDKDGEFIWVIVGAALIGGAINLGIKAYQGQIHSIWDGVAAFGVGAVSGAVGGLVGGVCFTVAGGAAAGVGGFLAGSAGGAGGAAVSAPLQSFGNHLFFGDPLMSPSEYLIAVAAGGLIGGVTNGVQALANGRNFWNGELPQRPQWGLTTDSEVFGQYKNIENGYARDATEWTTNKNASNNTQLQKYNPENDGAIGEWKDEMLVPGTKIDRYGTTNGVYASPLGTPYDMRSLPPYNSTQYNAYSVVKPIYVKSSVVAPWFGKIGMGIQYKFPLSFSTMLDMKIIIPLK